MDATGTRPILQCVVCCCFLFFFSQIWGIYKVRTYNLLILPLIQLFILLPTAFFVSFIPSSPPLPHPPRLEPFTSDPRTLKNIETYTPQHGKITKLFWVGHASAQHMGCYWSPVRSVTVHALCLHACCTAKVLSGLHFLHTAKAGCKIGGAQWCRAPKKKKQH